MMPHERGLSHQWVQPPQGQEALGQAEVGPLLRLVQRPPSEIERRNSYESSNAAVLQLDVHAFEACWVVRKGF